MKYNVISTAIRWGAQHGKRYGWIYGGAILLVWAIIVNRFPAGTIINGADVVQMIFVRENLPALFYEWTGRAALFYVPIYLAEYIGLSATAQLSVYMAMFVLGAYASFLLFMHYVFPRVPQYLAVVTALFYATNIFTLYVFTSTWGYTHYQIVYVFIPALTGLWIALLRSPEIPRYRWGFILCAAVCSMSFGNPAFAVSLALYIVVLTMAMYGTCSIRLSHAVVKSAIIAVIGAIAVNLYWLAPATLQIAQGVESVKSSREIVLSEALAKTSNAFPDTIRFLPTYERDAFYPENFPYPSMSAMVEVIEVVAFIPFLFVIYGLFFQRTRKRTQQYTAFAIVLIVFAILIARVRFPFEHINAMIFSLPGMNVLRGWDKTAIFFPFIVATLMMMAIDAMAVRARVWATLAVSGVIALTALPFYVGGIQTRLSYALKNQGEKHYETARYSALVRVPTEYAEARKVMVNDPGDYKVSMLPFAPGSSIGKVDLREWKVNAPHIGHVLFPVPYVEPNDYYMPQWIPLRAYRDQYYAPEWAVRWYGLIGIKYIVYHKDIHPALYREMEPSRTYLESQGFIHRVLETPSFILYRVPDADVFPYVYVSTAVDASLMPRIKGLSNRILQLRAERHLVQYTRKDPRTVHITIDSTLPGERIVLNEAYDSLYRAEADVCRSDGTRQRVLFPRDAAVRYANAWIVPDDICGPISIEYRPREVFSWSVIVSVVAILVATGMSIRSRRVS